MRQKTVKYYYYKKPKTGIYYCSPLSNDTGKKLYSISTGTKDYKEAKRIMDSWAFKNTYPMPYKKEKSKSITQLDVLSALSSMAMKREFGVDDVLAIIYELVDIYKYEIKNELEYFFNIIFSLLKLKIDVPSLIKENSKKQDSSIKFVDFVLNYWDYKNSAYIKELIAMGTPISEIPKENSFVNKGQSLKKYISWFDKNLLLKDITAEMINRFFSHLLRECHISEGYMAALAGSVIQPLHYAEKKQLINNGITPNITRYKAKSRKKEILTIEECNNLFSSITNFKDERHYCVNRMALETASRVGEILALKIEDLKISYSSITGKEECWVEINKSYDTATHKLDSTKTKISKTVTISDELLHLLKKLIEQNPYKDKIKNPFLFFHLRFSDRPISYSEIGDGFRKTMKNMGFARPNLTFHSYRHLAVVLLADGKASTREIMQITGHKTEKMVSRYANHETEAQKESKRDMVSKISKHLNNAT